MRPLFVHENERDSVEPKHHVRGTFSRRHLLDDDFEVIPTPGHTSGATTYLWDSGAHRFLFTGDTIYLSDGEWVAALLDSSDREAYLESLALIRELDFDVLVPWAASAGGDHYALTDRADARAASTRSSSEWRARPPSRTGRGCPWPSARACGPCARPAWPS